MLYPSELLARSGRASTVADGAKRGTSTKQLYSIPDVYASGMIRTARGRFAVTSMRTFHCLRPIPLAFHRLWSGRRTRRLAFNSTSTESGRAFQKSRRMRPSESCVTVPGMALAVKYQFVSVQTIAARSAIRFRNSQADRLPLFHRREWNHDDLRRRLYRLRGFDFCGNEFGAGHQSGGKLFAGVQDIRGRIGNGAALANDVEIFVDTRP